MYCRYKSHGFLGQHSKGYTMKIDNIKYIGVRWFTNYNHKNLFTGKNTPNINFWNKESDIIKTYRKLPRKLKKKIKNYL